MSYRNDHEIGHFACERDFYVFRNHMYTAYFEPYNFSKGRNHANKTFFLVIYVLFA